MFSIKRGATQPFLQVTLQDENRAGINLTDATDVIFQWYMANDGAAPVHTGLCNIVDAANGLVEYRWTPSDTVYAGDYVGEFQITFSTGDVLIVPSEGFVNIHIDRSVRSYHSRVTC